MSFMDLVLEPAGTVPPAVVPHPQIPARTILDSLLDPHFLLSPARDTSGKITDFTVVEANTAAADYYHVERETMLGRRLLEFLPADNAGGLLAMARDAHESGEPLVVNNYAFAFEIYGQERRFDIRAVRIDDEIVWTWRDVTERFLAAKRLAASEERYRLLAENSSDVVVRIRRGTIQWISPSVLLTFGYRADECTGRLATDFLEEDDRTVCGGYMQQLESGQHVRARKIVRSKDGTRHWIETHASPYLDANGRMDGFVATSRIVDAQVTAEQQLEHRARTDELTELLNRKEVLSRIETLGEQPRRAGQELAVLFCDLDRFKEINDIHGHAAGDEVLRATAMRLREILRTSDDLGARIGGDELLVVLHGVRGMEDAVAIAEKLRTAATQPITTPSGPVSTTLSIGVTLKRPEESTDALVARADSAMYRAKQAGRNRVVTFSAESAATT
jgi:diguanylate cyclase (GGDEF)-like protein/PAS domain S-box-containing protein